MPPSQALPTLARYQAATGETATDLLAAAPRRRGSAVVKLSSTGSPLTPVSIPWWKYWTFAEKEND